MNKIIKTLKPSLLKGISPKKCITYPHALLPFLGEWYWQ